jgi:hypothetical protein
MGGTADSTGFLTKKDYIPLNDCGELEGKGFF